MRIDNVHERVIPATPEQVWELVAGLGGPHDRLWPARWPSMRLDRPLAVGARGGHGPVRYHVEEMEPGRFVRFRFERNPHVDGTHTFDVLAVDGGTRLRHVMHGEVQPTFLPVWWGSVRWLHDACLEDLLDRAERELTGTVSSPAAWSPAVRVIRRGYARLA